MGMSRYWQGVAGMVVLAATGGALLGTDNQPLLLRAAAGAVGVTVVLCGAWWTAGQAGRGFVYYLRDDAGRVIYVGETGPRKTADASLEQRLAEHFDDAADRTWKHDICWANCTVARRCYTRWGRRRSERKRVEALTFANRFPLLGSCPPLHNDTYAGRRKTPLLSMTWYAIESRLNVEACWHRPVRFADSSTDVVPQASVAHAPVELEDDEEELLAAAARRVRSQMEQLRPPAVPWRNLDDDAVDAEFRRLAAGLLADGFGDDDLDGDATPSREVEGSGEAPPTGGLGGDRDIATSAGRDIDAGQPSHDQPQTLDGGPQTVENAATTDGGVDADTDVPSGGSSGNDGPSSGGSRQVKTCKVEGCREAVARYGRCATHAREWDAERQRRRRQKDGE